VRCGPFGTGPVVAINPNYRPTDVASLQRYGMRTVLMPGGHFLMMEDPDAFNGLLDENHRRVHRRGRWDVVRNLITAHPHESLGKARGALSVLLSQPFAMAVLLNSLRRLRIWSQSRLNPTAYPASQTDCAMLPRAARTTTKIAYGAITTHA
jgi:hypothetical protein